MESSPASSLPELPDKLYFRVGEVADLLDVPPYVLRFWEKEFPSLAPKKSSKGHRLYRRKDVETFFQIKRLLYDERFTIEGARKHLGQQSKKKGSGSNEKAGQRSLFEPPGATLEHVRKELAAILDLLK